MIWCYACRIGTKYTLALHQNGCPPDLVKWEQEDEEE
jgi:hypothetical protein